MLKDVLTQKGLSHREAEVAELVSKGLSNKEVAGQLFVTEKTVKFHLTNIYKKMAVKSRAQLIVWCVPHVDFVNNGQAPIQANATTTGATTAQPAAAISYSASGIIPGNNSGNNNGSI
jgi:LuxR family transcriptional regulator, positive regulator of biofilm formation